MREWLRLKPAPIRGLVVATVLLGTPSCSRRSAPPAPSNGDGGLATTTAPTIAGSTSAAPLETIPQVPVDHIEQALGIAVGALAKLTADPAAAERDFRSLGSFCIGKAGLAYLAWRHGDPARASSYLASATVIEGPGWCTTVDSPSLGTRILSAMRHAIENLNHHRGHENAHLPCEIFDAHPKEAFAASAQYWGSTLDLPALDAELDCAERSIRRSLPPERSEAAVHALRSVARAALAVAHEPSGTMWISTGYGLNRTAAEAAIAPELCVLDANLASRLESATAKLKQHVRGAEGRLAAFRATRARESPSFAAALCRISERRGHLLSADVCKELADYTFTLALTQWLETEPWDAFYMEGGP